MSVAAVVCGLAFATLVAPHDYHKTLAEVEFDAKRGRVEVGFWVWPNDLIEELQARVGRRVDLDKEPRLDAMLTAWLTDVWRLRDAKGKKLPMRWVGKELKLDSCWLYFEFDVGKSPASFEIENRTFFAIAKTPVHTTAFLRGKKRRARNLTRKSPRWKLELAVKPAPKKRVKPVKK